MGNHRKKEQHYQVTYTLEQRITEGESSKTVRSTYHMTVSLAVKYLDNQTMTTQSQFDLVLEKNGKNWKIVK